VSYSFREATLIDFRCHDGELIDCVFSGMLKRSGFNGRVREPDPYLGRERNEFRSNDFTAADLRDVAFRTRIDLDSQFLLEGSDYLLLRDAAGVLERVRQAVLEWRFTLGPLRSRDLDEPSNVAGDQLLSHRMFQRRAEGRVDVLDQPRPPAVGPEIVDHEPDVAGRELVKPPSGQGPRDTAGGLRPSSVARP